MKGVRASIRPRSTSGVNRLGSRRSRPAQSEPASRSRSGGSMPTYVPRPSVLGWPTAAAAAAAAADDDETAKEDEELSE
eukprot:scaffold110193_cov30-Tisochrysis_lutea.AAC.4